MGQPSNNMQRSDEHNARGIELANRGWLEEAANEFRKAISLDPASAHAHDNLATVLAEQGSLFAALREYVEAVRADPENPTAHHYLASFLAAYGRDLSVTEYRRALELEHDFPEAHLNLAMVLAERGAYDDAARELQIAHEQAPDDEVVRHELACCLMDLERFPEAITHLKAIIRANPEHTEAYVDLGVSYTAQGFYAKAEEYLRQALELTPEDFATNYHLATLYATWGRSDEALERLSIATKHDRERARRWLQDERAFDDLRPHDSYRQLFED